MAERMTYLLVDGENIDATLGTSILGRRPRPEERPRWDRLLEWASPAELTRAVGQALELGAADADAVRLILEHRRERPVGLFCLDGRPHLKLVSVPPPDLLAYAGLAAGVAP